MSSRIRLDQIGLCATCLRTLRDVFRARHGVDPLCFEVLDRCTAGCADGHAGGPDAPPYTASQRGAKGATPPPPIGLCANCALFENCTLPRPESGVWHCEEYT